MALLPIDAVRAAESPLVADATVCHELGAGWTVDTALPPSWIEQERASAGADGSGVVRPRLPISRLTTPVKVPCA